MFYSIHVLIGILLGLHLESIPLIILLAIALHFIADMVPHWDGHYDKELFHKHYIIDISKSLFMIHNVDLIMAIILLWIIYSKVSNPLILVGAFFSLLPDLSKIIYYTKYKHAPLFKKYLIFHSKIQTEINWKLGTLTQITFAIILLKLIF